MLTAKRIPRLTAALLAALLVVPGASAQFYNPFERRPEPRPDPRYDQRYAPPSAPFFRPAPPPAYPSGPAPRSYYDRRSDSYYNDPGGAVPRADPYAAEQRRAEQQRAAEAAARRRAERARARALERAAAEVAKLKEASTHIVVFGDSFAELLGGGIDEAFSENPAVAVIRKTRGESGLTRPETYDWVKTARETLAGSQKISFAVMMLGANDRQAIREGETSHEVLSERWKELYRQRIDALVQVFKEKAVPLIWVGAAPMRNERQNADMAALNEMFRDRVQREGGTYVDIWPGFVDDENHYVASGPDIAGQVARLRTGDGVGFTRAGARKASHFVDIALKRLIGGVDGTAVAALPGPSAVPGAPVPDPGPAGPASPRDAARAAEIERRIEASLPALPEPPGLLPLVSRPLAGPVVPLTGTDLAPGGTLVASRPRLEGDAAYFTERALREGIAPPPKAGRADDFRWPR